MYIYRYKSLEAKIDRVVAEGRAEMDLLNRYFHRILPHSSHSKNFPSVLMLPGHVLALTLHFRTKVHGYGTTNRMDATDVFSDTDALESEAWIVHFSGGPKPWNKDRASWIREGKRASTEHFAKYNLMFLDEYNSGTTSVVPPPSRLEKGRKRAFVFHASNTEEMRAATVNINRLRRFTPSSCAVSYVILVRCSFRSRLIRSSRTLIRSTRIPIPSTRNTGTRVKTD